MSNSTSVKMYLSFLVVAAALSAPLGFASEGHDDHGDNKAEAKGDAHEHGDEEHESEESGSEASSVVGPEKGITEANEKDGFKLSPEATRNFEIKTISLSADSAWLVPTTAIAFFAHEVNVYRLRKGFYKRVDFKTLSKDKNGRRIASSELRSGDTVVVAGLGFLRVAEIAAFGGAPAGHSH